MSIEDLPPGTIRKRVGMAIAVAAGSAIGASQIFKEPESLFSDSKAPANTTDSRPAPDTGPKVTVELASGKISEESTSIGHN